MAKKIFRFKPKDWNKNGLIYFLWINNFLIDFLDFVKMGVIVGVTIALEKKNIKKQVVDIIEKCLENAQDEASISNDKDVILVSVTYNDTSDKITLSKVLKYKNNITSTDFSHLILVSIQKETHKNIEEFLKDEINA